MDLAVWFLVRAILGLFLASALGAAGFFVGWMLWSPSSSASLASILRVCGAGIGAGIGGFVGWLRPEDTRSVKLATLGLALLGGLAGAWGGLIFGAEVYEKGIFARGTPISTILGGAIVCNLVPGLFNIYWARNHARF